jgi:hypothetical protein
MAARKRSAKAQAAKPAASVSKPRTKQQRMIDMLRRPEGATISAAQQGFRMGAAHGARHHLRRAQEEVRAEPHID